MPREVETVTTKFPAPALAESAARGHDAAVPPAPGNGNSAAPPEPGVGGRTGPKHLALRGGQTALLDPDVFATASGYSWRLGAGGYVVRTGEHGRTVYLHRDIMMVSSGTLVTFLNGDRLDLRRANLRLIQRSDIPRRRRTRSASGFRGVVENPFTGRFVARIRVPGQNKRLVLQEFDTPSAAAECYDAFARAFLGELAILNFSMKRFYPMAFGNLPFHLGQETYVDPHSPDPMSDTALTGERLPVTLRDVETMSTEREEDALMVFDGTSPSQYSGSHDSTGVYAGIVRDAKVVAPAPDYGNLFVVSGSSPPAVANRCVPPSAEHDGMVEPCIDVAPASALATQAFSLFWHSSIADFGNKFVPHPVRTGCGDGAAGSDTLVAGSANPAACHGRSARAGGPRVDVRAWGDGRRVRLTARPP